MKAEVHFNDPICFIMIDITLSLKEFRKTDEEWEIGEITLHSIGQKKEY